MRDIPTIFFGLKVNTCSAAIDCFFKYRGIKGKEEKKQKEKKTLGQRQ